MENISLISDIHIEHWIDVKFSGATLDKKMKDFVDNILKPVKSDVLIIPGDISDYNHLIKVFLKYLISLNLYKKIFIISGNHEMYLSSNKLLKEYKNYINKINDIKKICKELEVEFLDGNIIEYEGLKIGGNTMWYDGSYAKKNYFYNDTSILKLWREHYNDSSYIKGLDFSYELNQDYSIYNYGKKQKIISFNPFKFFDKEKEKMIKIINDCDIYISHIPPYIPENLLNNIKYNKDLLTFYIFDGKELIDDKKRLWFFGHIHKNFDFFYKNTTFISNPLGYKNKDKNKNDTYNQIKVINIKEFF